MGKIFKLLGGLLALIVLVVIGVLIYVVLHLNGLIKSGVNEYGPQLLGVPVVVKDVDINLQSGSASLQGLRIANPKGFSDGSALSLDNVVLELDLGSLQKDVIVVNRLLINGASILAEEKSGRINLQVIKNNLAKNSSDFESRLPSGDTDKPATNTKPIKFAIKQFDFTQATAVARSEQLGEQAVQIDDFRLENIGTPERGLTFDSAAKTLLQPLLKKILADVREQALKDTINKKINKELDKALGDKADKVKETLKGLFK